MLETAFRIETLRSPIGTILIATDSRDRLVALSFGDDTSELIRMIRHFHGPAAVAEKRSGARSVAASALARYFAGDLHAIDSLKVDSGGTDFQRAVWAELRRIPAGATLSYGELAARVGRPKAVRAAGLANGSNPISIVVPCHRVIGADGSLTGYGGGLDRKRWLLAHEGAELALDRPHGRPTKRPATALSR